MLVSFVPAVAQSDFSTVDIWEGSTKEPVSIVTENGIQYYEISSCAELAYIAENGGVWLEKNYRLVVDLDLNKIEWSPIGDPYCPFSGSLDGNGHRISNLNITAPLVCAGLFGNVEDAEIKNLTVDNVCISFDCRTARSY